MSNSGKLLIGQLAKGAGVKPDTVRFYERNGLLAKPERTAAGYRVYDEAALQRLRFIRKAQSLGFSLDEIQRILHLRGHGRETCRCVVAMAEATLNETKTKLDELQKFYEALEINLKEMETENARPHRCGILRLNRIERDPVNTSRWQTRIERR